MLFLQCQECSTSVLTFLEQRICWWVKLCASSSRFNAIPDKDVVIIVQPMGVRETCYHLLLNWSMLIWVWLTSLEVRLLQQGLLRSYAKHMQVVHFKPFHHASSLGTSWGLLWVALILSWFDGFPFHCTSSSARWQLLQYKDGAKTWLQYERQACT